MASDQLDWDRGVRGKEVKERGKRFSFFRSITPLPYTFTLTGFKQIKLGRVPAELPKQKSTNAPTSLLKRSHFEYVQLLHVLTPLGLMSV
jgi:hypothetical protein